MKTKNKLALLAMAAVMVWLPLQAAAAYETSAYIPASIRLEGFDRGKFAVELTALEGAPRPKETVLRRSGAGGVLFGPIVYAAPGVYRYHIEQNPGSDAAVAYDASQYEATVLVENSGSGLHAQVSAVRLDAAAGGTPVKAEVVFTNRQKGGGAHSGGQKAEGQGAAEAKAALPSTAAAAPQTGDAAFGAAAWACLTAGALAGAAVLLRRRKEK
ncbi:MAG: LPXTG cell wall anchor domain-containing protein [Subdoligranulum sp.]|nr:LPXTG cell wall anchor domain-containing protein [Subdoligranulum sp.]